MTRQCSRGAMAKVSVTQFRVWWCSWWQCPGRKQESDSDKSQILLIQIKTTADELGPKVEETRHITRKMVQRICHSCHQMVQRRTQPVLRRTVAIHIILLGSPNGIRTLCPLYSGCGRTLGLLCSFRFYISLKCSFLNGLSSAVELNEIIASSVLCYNNWYYWQWLAFLSSTCKCNIFGIAG